ncbi:MAG: ABC transporter permease [Bryobacteraceae bacterium]
MPGVESVALALDLPLFGGSRVAVELPSGIKTTEIRHTAVDANYFDTVGIRMLSGRGFNSNDRENSPPVAVINRKMAEMFWPGQEPVGRTIMAGDPASRFTVIGVVPNGKYDDIDEAPQPFLYYALSQNYRGAISVIARTKGNPSAWVQPFARALRGLGLHILIDPETLDTWLNFTLFTQRVAAVCVAIPGIAACDPWPLRRDFLFR